MHQKAAKTLSPEISTTENSDPAWSARKEYIEGKLSIEDEKMPEDVEHFYTYTRPMPEPMPIYEEKNPSAMKEHLAGVYIDETGSIRKNPPPLISQIGGDHYHKRAIQPITFILANNLGFCEGNVVKYITRWKDKGGVEDLRKARHYLDFLIEEAEKSNG